MTKKEAKKIMENFEKLGYKVKKGYCCHHECKDLTQLVKIGTNISKTLGWRWDLYLDTNYCTLYLDGYSIF